MKGFVFFGQDSFKIYLDVLMVFNFLIMLLIFAEHFFFLPISVVAHSLSKVKYFRRDLFFHFYAFRSNFLSAPSFTKNQPQPQPHFQKINLSLSPIKK